MSKAKKVVTERKTINKLSETISLAYLKETTLVEFVSKFQKLIDKHGSDAIIDPFYDENTMAIMVPRLETDEEYNRRIEYDRLRSMTPMEADVENLRKLMKKYPQIVAEEVSKAMGDN